MMTKHLSLFFVLLMTAHLAWSQADSVITAKVEGHIFKPAKGNASEENVASLKLPEGFRITRFAENLKAPRMMAVGEDGTLYVTRRQGDVVMLKDTDQDGRADINKTALKLKQVHGLAVDGRQMYMITVNDVFVSDVQEGGTLGKPRKIVENLPDGGQHNNRTIEFGPDGKLYISVGSTCNACAETSEESATMVVVNKDGSGRRIFARGLRNLIGFDWHPETGDLYGMDHGIDWLGDNEQKEELNKITEGAHYGWPYIYGEGKHNPADQPDGMTYEEFASKVTMPEMTYTAHSAPLDMIFYEGEQFPEEYRGDAIVTLHGSWNRAKPSGYKVVRVHFNENGKPVKFTDFITGWLTDNSRTQFGRVTGLAAHPDGSIFISDDSNGVVYQVTYTGS